MSYKKMIRNYIKKMQEMLFETVVKKPQRSLEIVAEIIKISPIEKNNNGNLTE